MSQPDNITKGMLAGMGAFGLFAFMNVFAKLLSENHHIVEIAFYRNLIAAIPFLFVVFVLNKKEILKVNQRPLGVAFRAILGTVSLVVTFSAFAAMPMAETTAFLFTSSLIIPILGYFFLSEKVGPYRWAAILIGFIGVMIMLQPNGNVNTLGIILALSAAAMHATLQTILRYLGRTEKAITITFYFVTVGTIITALPMPWVATMPTWEEIPLFLGLGITGALAQFLISIAFGNAPAAVVTVFNYSGIIWATILGWMIWNDWPAQTIWIGGSIVIASNIFIIWRESRLRKVTGDRVRAKF